MLLYMETTQKIIAKNLKKLIDKHQLTQSLLAKKTGVSQKTISNILNPNYDGNVTTQSVEKIAKHFGLQTYEMMIPNFPIDEPSTGIEKVISCYASSSTTGRENIKRVAELEVRYSLSPKNDN